MSQTPTQTPSRRRAAVDTPGSVRSNTSTSDRSVLLERTEELELEIEDLRRAIASERERRRSTQRQLEKQRATDATRDEVRTTLLEKLRQMDDDALTALLGASVQSLARVIAGADSAWVAVDAGLVPSKSVGVEGTGSASDIDRRLALSAQGVQHELHRTRHAASVNQWLNDRQRRSNALVQSLAQFSYLDIDTLDQASSSERRSIHLAGSFARLFPIDIRFVVDDSGSSPAIQHLAIDIPSWLSTTLNTPHALFSRLLKRNDLPAVLLMLRTMVPLLSLRRNMFTSLMESYTDLVRSHIRAWESSHGIDFAPWYPPGTSRKRASSRVDETLGRSLIATDAETLVLQNSHGASLTLRFRIVWNRYGHAVPQLDAEPNVPAGLMDPTATAFLQQFDHEFKHLCKVAVQQDGIVGWQDEEQDQAVGRWGLMPALHATIAAFFRLAIDDASDTGSD
ncbi:hypothetical protein PaG_01716 [Moesziomyces aphidis]|jgi:hypothetical protein|uniref:Uncharacterized protein n=1 Tax=Moesziomyces aphidis TaxID=84754 RepID=W3VP28_MOEAP|nr:hypothetical protein PaG_01716 [Moesziomyces aphidis]